MPVVKTSPTDSPALSCREPRPSCAYAQSALGSAFTQRAQQANAGGMAAREADASTQSGTLGASSAPKSTTTLTPEQLPAAAASVAVASVAVELGAAAPSVSGVAAQPPRVSTAASVRVMAASGPREMFKSSEFRVQSSE